MSDPSRPRSNRHQHSYTPLPTTTTSDDPSQPLRPSTPSPSRTKTRSAFKVWALSIFSIAFIITAFSFVYSEMAEKSLSSGYEFSVVEGFFAHDDPRDEKVASAVLPRLGLLDSSPDRWINFRTSLADLKESAPKGTKYKVFYIQRHGQGWHNVAESHYGTEAWDALYSKLYTDGNMTWGPDPSLTPLGISQALEVNRVWKEELSLEMKEEARARLPDVVWTSPLRRAAETLNHTYFDTALSNGLRPVFKENLRESIGTHTCDARSTSYFLATTFSRLANPSNSLNYDFEPGFTVNDERWKPDVRESSEEQQGRTRRVLGEVFDGVKGDYVGLVGHGGTIGSFFEVVGHKPLNPPTGAFIPVVVKAVRRC
ncbi:histidine phosphatase superfamily [Mrakia frigida]|uniref:histidine phosphatase family protein n=1 Tax=Mrakia frigida TaxID=29902 RepID=UPI003FCBFCC4